MLTPTTCITGIGMSSRGTAPNHIIYTNTITKPWFIDIRTVRM